VARPGTGPFSTIYLRLLVPFALLLLVGTVVAWWLGTALLSRTLEDRVSSQINHAVDVVSQPSFPLTEQVLGRLSNLLRASVLMVDVDGNIELNEDIQRRAELLDALRAYHSDWVAEGRQLAEYRIKVSGRDYLLVLQRAEARWLPDYSAVLAFAELSDVQSATQRGGLWLAGLTFCGISLLAFVGHLVARSITVPVGELSAMAGRIAAGDRAVRVDIHRRDEVGALAQSLNSMAQRLAQYEQQLVEQSRLATLGELSVKVAHEIRNPLTAIKMQMQLLADELPEAALARLDSMLDEVRRLELIVASSLQLGHPEKLDRRLLDLNTLVRDVVHLMEPQLQHRHIEVDTVLGEALPQVLLDGDRVKQILLNLLTNAMDELAQGGRIRVSTTRQDNAALVLEVCDSGTGVPQRQRETLFEKSDSSKATGFGLGLRVTRELIELHGGTIEIADSDMGGALFRVRFPMES
jgi:signal transduction histidine kinase